MKQLIVLMTLGLLPWMATADPATTTNPYYGVGLCDKPGYTCIKVGHGDTWQKLFPDETARDLVQRLNRSDTYLPLGKTLVVPKDLTHTTLLDVAPFPKQIAKQAGKIIVVDQYRLAWGAFDANGLLVKWGPLSSGRDFCPDVKRSCRTFTGIFYVFNKKGKDCKSNVFPVGKGGAIMPYCMFFYKGYALHGSDEVVGYRDSHGCVRLFSRDAEWLNEHFVSVATKEGALGTKVVIQKLTDER